MGRVTVRRPVVRLGLDTVRRVETIAVEEPLELRGPDGPIMTTMRTPGHDVELVHGWLFGEGVIRGVADVVEARYCAGSIASSSTGLMENTYNLLEVDFAAGVVVPPDKVRRFPTTSACGVCGSESIAALRERSAYDLSSDETRFDRSVLLRMPELMRSAQSTYDRTGGVHAAALVSRDGHVLVVREDVGRHNAVDKVVGWALLQGRLPAAGHALVVSGRASFELVQKAAMAAIPALVAVSAPSSLAVRLADDAGLTLCAFVLGGEGNCYTHARRVEDSL